MSILLAKSNPPEESLLDHTKNCLTVYNSLQEQMPFLTDIAKNPDFFRASFLRCRTS